MSTVGTIYEALQSAASVAPCVLRYVSTTQLRLDPISSNKIKINGAMRPIPAAGITVANTGLAASTNYYVYAYWTGSVTALEFATAGHSTSATAGNIGTEIKTGDDSRSLVGFIRTNASTPGQFIKNNPYQWVRSWFNRHLDQAAPLIDFGAQVTTSQTAPAVSSGTWLLDILLWANEAFTANFLGSGYNDSAGLTSFTAFWWDGAINNGGNVGQDYSFTGAESRWKPYGFSETVSFPTDARHTVFHVMWTQGTLFYLGPSTAFITMNARIGAN